MKETGSLVGSAAPYEVWQAFLVKLRSHDLDVEDLRRDDVVACLSARLEMGILDTHLLEILEERFLEVQGVRLANGFLEPPESGVLEGMHVLDSWAGRPVYVPARGHVVVAGSTDSGKTSFLGTFVAEASRDAATLVMAANESIARIERVQDTHVIVDGEEARMDFFRALDGVNERMQDQVVCDQIARVGNVQYGRLVALEVVREIRDRGERPTMPLLRHELEKKKYSGFSRRQAYRDSFLMNLGELVDCSMGVLECKAGMDLMQWLDRNIVVNLWSFQPRVQAFVIRTLFALIYLLGLSGRKLGRPIVVAVDEGQVFAEERELGAQMLQLRHGNIRYVAGYQNASSVESTVLGNVETIVAFRSLDARDRAVLGRAMRMAPDQTERLAILNRGECVCFSPRWRRPFLARARRVTFARPDQAWVRERSRRFLEGMPWEEWEAPSGDDEQNSTKHDVDLFMRDVLDQRFEFDAQKKRWERCGVRSASRQQAVMKHVLASGRVRKCRLAVGRGHPIVLVEPTEQELEREGVKWRKGRGKLETRAATALVAEKVRGLGCWEVVPEGSVEVGKQVDMLCHHEDGEVVSIEIAQSAAHEVHNALACVRSGVHRHYVICTNGKTRKVVKERFREVEELREHGGVEVIMLSTALRADWEP